MTDLTVVRIPIVMRTLRPENSDLGRHLSVLKILRHSVCNTKTGSNEEVRGAQVGTFLF